MKQKWDFNDVRVSKFDVGKVRFGTSQRYEFRIRLGGNQLLFKLLDQVGSWNKFRKPKSDLGSLIRQISSLAVLDTFKLEGPFELRVDGHHQFSLSLPVCYVSGFHFYKDYVIALLLFSSDLSIEVSLVWSSPF